MGEVLGHLQKGDTVTVLEQISLRHTQAGEPAEWAKIAMPAGIPVWIDGDYVAADTKTVKARRVNLRGGPGENFSVVGRLEKGEEVKEVRSEKGWVAVEAPTNAYAYVAAELLDIQPAPPPVAAAPVATLPPAPVPEAPQVVTVATPAAPVAATTEPAVAAPTAPAPTQQSEVDQELAALRRATAAAAAPAPAPSRPAPAVAPVASGEPGTPRIVTREGFVHRAYNIQAPADYELHDIQSGKIIDYLQVKPGQNFKMYVGTRVTVTGPEGINSRWSRVPVLEVQSVDLMP
jgi:hypothetical protein